MGNRHKPIKTQKQEQKLKVKEKNKTIFFIISFIALSVSFICSLISIVLVSHNLKEQEDKMVLGKDYFYEAFTIIKKDIEYGVHTSNSSTSNEDYFIYYSNKGRIEVSPSDYEKYKTGDKYFAYTDNHYDFVKDKRQLLPGYTDNEITKAVCAISVSVLCLLILWRFLDKYMGKITDWRNKRYMEKIMKQYKEI